jgi:predicted  nucleic acid-binding Zn-ribbon protein
MWEKLNNLGAGVILGVLLAGLPIWIYAEKKIEKRVTSENKLTVIERDLKALKEALATDSTTLHRRITELDNAADEKRAAQHAALLGKLEDHAKASAEARDRMEGRVWTTEQDMKALDKTMAVMHARESHPPNE